MATWPSGSKASTSNLDSGADKPSLARADLKQNVDNVNAIIDMFNIASPSDNQILKYDAANSRFVLATDSSGIANVVEDTTPQLGGNLDVNGNSITNSSVASPDLILEAGDGGDVFVNAGTFRPVEGINLNNSDLFISTSGESYNVKIQGITYPKTDGTSNQFLKTDGAGVLSFASINQATGNEIESLVEDTTPQLGGELDGQGNTISDINLRQYKETNYALSYAATITPDVANGNVQTVTLTGNVTFNAFANPESGQSLTLIVKQDGTGSRTLTSSMKFSGGNKTLSTAANSVDIISVFYDGTNYWASLSTDFK